MTDRTIGPKTDDGAIAVGGSADDGAIAADDSADDRAQHASADVAPELFGW